MIFHCPPETPILLNDWDRSCVVIRIRSQENRLPPPASTILRLPYGNSSVFPASSHQIKSTALQKQIRPELVVKLSYLIPRCTAIPGEKDACNTRHGLTRVRPKEVVRTYI